LTPHPGQSSLVTATSVYHWSLEDANPPVKVFDQHPCFGPKCQIITYKVSPDMKWSILGGISAGQGGVVTGNMPLYSIEKKSISTTQRTCSIAQTYGNLGTFGSGMLMLENGAGGIPMPTPISVSGRMGIDMPSFRVPQQPQMLSPGMVPNSGMSMIPSM
jgi:hypothetical protein